MYNPRPGLCIEEDFEKIPYIQTVSKIKSKPTQNRLKRPMNCAKPPLHELAQKPCPSPHAKCAYACIHEHGPLCVTRNAQEMHVD